MCVCLWGSRQTEASRGGRLQLQSNERAALTHRRTHLNPGTQEEEEEEGESEGETLREAARESEGVREGETGRVWGRTPWLQIRGWLLCFCGLYPSRLWVQREPAATKVRLNFISCGGTRSHMDVSPEVRAWSQSLLKSLLWVSSLWLARHCGGPAPPKLTGGGRSLRPNLDFIFSPRDKKVWLPPLLQLIQGPPPPSGSLCVPLVLMWGLVSVTAEQPPLLQPWQELLNQRRMWEGQGASPVQGWGRLCSRSEQPEESRGRLRSHRAGSERHAARKSAIWMSDFISLSRSISPLTSSFCFSGRFAPVMPLFLNFDLSLTEKKLITLKKTLLFRKKSIIKCFFFFCLFIY